MKAGKYDFPGIEKLGAAGLRGALLATPALAFLAKGGIVSDFLLKLFVNWCANNGLVLLNIGAIIVEGEWDQDGFDNAMDQAVEKITQGGGVKKLTPEQIKAIDDEVIKAARKFIVIGKP